MDIILYLIHFIQYQHKQICWLLNFICRYIPLNQWAFDDSHSPKYQKFKLDELPIILHYKQDWTYKDLIPYYEKRYGKNKYKLHYIYREFTVDFFSMDLNSLPENVSSRRDLPCQSLFHFNIIGRINVLTSFSFPERINAKSTLKTNCFQGAWIQNYLLLISTLPFS